MSYYKLVKKKHFIFNVKYLKRKDAIFVKQHVQYLTQLLNNNDVNQAVDYLRNKINPVNVQSQEPQSIFIQLKDNNVSNYILFKE